MERLLRIIATGAKDESEIENIENIDIISDISLRTKRLVKILLSHTHLGFVNLSLCEITRAQYGAFVADIRLFAIPRAAHQ